MKARVMGAVGQVPSRTRAEQRRVAVAVGVAIAVLVGIEFRAFGEVQVGSRPVVFMVATTLAWCASIVGLLALLRSRGPLGPPTALLLGGAFSSLVFPFAMGLLGNVLYPATSVPVPGHPGLLCVELSLTWSTAPLVAWVFVRRATDPVHPVALGVAMGALAGCLAAVMVNLRCTYTDPSHVALGHVLPAAIQVGVGAMFGRVLLALRAQQSQWAAGAAVGGATAGWLALLITLSVQSSCPTHVDPHQLAVLMACIAVGASVGAALTGLRRVQP
jgi:hypothetical protein